MKFDKIVVARSDFMAFDLSILEYGKILTRLESKAQTNDGKAMVKTIRPLTDETLLKNMLFEVEEAYRFVQNDLTPTFGGIHPIKAALNRARIGAMLSSDDFMDILSHIYASNHLKRHMRSAQDQLEHQFEILKYSDELVYLKPLKEAIDSVFDRRGQIKDDASSTLKTLRHKLKSIERRIKDSLENILNKESDKLTEKLTTIRYERYVVPVKLSDKNTLKGTILDYSSSGETVYIEPEAVRQLTAQKLKLQTDEKKEIDKILYALTAQVETNRTFLAHNTRLFTHLDVMFAKARYGYAIEGSVPIISKRVNLLKARHPLIEPDEVVANTIAFDDDVRMMIITGSNTGGKTVTLKTLGLLSLMAQSSMMIPALPKSEIRLFNAIRADIGDEQSIEQSLSTFSSHMSRIVDIISHYDDNQLVLLDELGSGTDPKEGSSLAMSILSYLSKHDSIVVATTHYPELKAYAYTSNHIMNASVEFNEKTLKPTYKLLLRTPGESHAFLISKRLGLKQAIIEEAKHHAHTDDNEISDLIDTLKTESKRLEKSLDYYETLNQDILQEKEALSKEKKALQTKKETLKETMTLQMNQEINAMREKAKKLIDELEQMKSQSYKAHEIAQKKHDVKAIKPNDEPKESTTKNHAYTPGETVYLIKYNRYGELIKKQKGNQWLVQMGTLQSVLSEEDFEFIKEKATPENAAKPRLSKGIKKTTKSTLDLRGMRVHEAEDALEKYLDDCALSNQPFATIIHGYGTLALRKMVKDVLSQNNAVVSHRDGGSNEGGKGATVVYFE